MIWKDLPEDTRRLLLEKRLVPGRILHVHCSFTNPPKHKFLVYICHHSPQCSFFIINSEINQFKQNRPSLSQCQVKIDQVSHPFLDHDSYVDCSKVQTISFKDLSDQLTKSNDGFKNIISLEVKKAILVVVKNTKTLSQQEKIYIQNALQ